MKKPLLLILLLTISYSLFAQKTEKINEAGLIFYDLDSYGITYRTGTNKSLWRLSTTSLNGNHTFREEVSEEYEYNQDRSGVNLQIGKEYRKIATDNFEIRYGADLNFFYACVKAEHTNPDNEIERFSKSSSDRYGINLILGFNYLLNNNLVIGAEILPAVSYSTTKTESQVGVESEKTTANSETIGFRLSNNSVLLSLVYRF